MAFEGKRKTLPSARWSGVIDVLEAAHWTFDEYCAAPAELVDEWSVRIQARNFVEARQAKRAEQQTHRRR